MCAAHSNKIFANSNQRQWHLWVAMNRNELKNPSVLQSLPGRKMCLTVVFLQGCSWKPVWFFFFFFCSCSFPRNCGFQALILTQPDQYFVKTASEHVGCYMKNTKSSVLFHCFVNGEAAVQDHKTFLGFWWKYFSYFRPKHADHTHANHHKMDKNLQFTQKYTEKKPSSMSVVKILQNTVWQYISVY